MAFLPARMTRLLVGGHQSHLAGAIATLHEQGAVHLEDYHDPTGTTRIGTPLPAGDEASALLVQCRGLRKALAAEGAAPSGPGSAATVAQAAAAIQPTLDHLGALRSRLAALDAEEAALLPLSGLDVDLGLAASLRSVKLHVGSVRADPTGLPAGAEVERSGSAIAVLVPAAQAAAAEKALAAAGFLAAAVPPGQGTPAKRLESLRHQRTALEADLSTAEAGLASLRKQWGPLLAGAELTLAAKVEQTQAPLQFGVTPTTFHVEGWVPVSKAAQVQQALAAKFGSSLYVEDLGDAPIVASNHTGVLASPGHHDPHHEEKVAQHGSGPASGHENHHGSTAADEPPVHLENKGPAKPYEFFLGLLGKPRYQEIDPTKLMLVFFPLFFGLMVGDLAVGLMIMGVGFYLKNNRIFGIGGPSVGRGLVAGGLMSALVGLFVFGEALGIHFVVDAHAAEAGELSWENILGLHLGDHGLLYKTGAAHVANAAGAVAGAAAGAITTHASEATGLAGILTPHSDVHLSLGGVVLGWYSKTHDTMALLVWAMLIGLVHIVLGLLLGYRNVAQAHGHKLAIQEKGAWLSLMVGGAMAALLWGTVWGYVGVGLAVASVALLYMGAQHVIGVGFIALLEVPGLAGNILSYTRLAAIGASKAGMAIAFATIAFDVVGGGDVHSVVGWVVYLLGFGLILALSIIAGTLQSLRLQFVEFFGKFYQGGGRPYLPFGRRAA